MKAQQSIIILGETLFDFYFDSVVEVVPGHKYAVLNGAPGGAPANVAANLASMGRPVSLITSFSDDPLGVSLKTMLLERGIELGLSPTHSNTRTPFAMVMNSSVGERSFSLFLRDSSLELIDQITLNLGSNVDLFHFGSVLMIFEVGVKVTYMLLEQLSTMHTIRSYDINIRPDILKANTNALPHIMDVLTQVDVLKLSDEDLEWIQQHVNPSLVNPEDYFNFGIKLVAYTEGARGATLLTPTERCFIPAPDVAVVDTTGGGDAFIAGVLASLHENGWTHRDEIEHLGKAELQEIGAKASKCANRILLQSGAMPPL